MPSEETSAEIQSELGGDFRSLLLHRRGCLALAVTEIVQLGTTHRTAFFHFDLGDTGRMDGKYPLHTLTEADATDSEVSIDAGTLATDHDACILLNSFLVTLDDARVDADGIPDLKRCDVGFELFFFDSGDDAHDGKMAGNCAKVVG